MAEKTYTQDEVADLMVKVMEQYLQPVYMTTKQVAECLHFKSEDYVRSLAQQGKIKGFHTDGRWRFTPRDVRNYAENRIIVPEKP